MRASRADDRSEKQYQSHSPGMHAARAAVAGRAGPFGDYSQGPEDERLNSDNVIRV